MDVHQKREFFGFSTEMDTPKSSNIRINSTAAEYEAFAE